MKCPKCHSDNREGLKFCEECGARLEVTCPKCGAKIPYGKKFCGECGQSLAEFKITRIDYSQPRSYIPRFLADKILTTRSNLEGERKLVTVLFADVANYTSISEKLDSEKVLQIMDGCFKVLMDEIHKYEGTIDKFTGDGVMALFGAPVAHEDHAQRACHAAFAIHTACQEYGQYVLKEHGMEFKLRLGLNSGPVVVSSVGNDLRMDYTAIGDTVNLASRMQSIAEPGTILVSDATYRLAKDFFKFKSLGKLNIKGKEDLLEAYTLLSVGNVETRFEAAVVKGLTKFVGREKEIAVLKDALQKAESGYGQVVGIVGEAGVGKSRVLLELRRSLVEGEYTYLEGRCLHYGSSMAFLPLLDILRSYFDIKDVEQEPVIKKKMEDRINQLDKNINHILAPLHDILSLKVDDEEYLKLEPPQRREKTFEAIRDLLVRESQKKTLVLAVEDLHWIDKTSEEYLTYFIDWFANSKILLILLYRPEYSHPWGSKSYYRHIHVDQLSAKSSAELLQYILEGGEVVPELRELILSRAGGNPLFVEEFTHTLLENGSIKKKDHQYVFSRKISDIQVPDTIQGIIAARMDRLEDNLKRIMQLASVIGRDFAFRVLSTITGMREDLKPSLLELQGLEFIYEKSLFPELEYIFKHALTQEVAYNSLLIKRRQEIHEKIGKAIEVLYADRIEEFYEMLAHHYSRSENTVKAFEYLKLAGRKASRNYSNWEAFRFYRQAIDLLNSAPRTEENDRRKLEIYPLMVGPIRFMAYTEDSVQVLQEGERLSKDLGDKKALATISGTLGQYYSMIGDSLQGTIYAEQCFKEAEEIQDVDLAAPTGHNLCNAYYLSGQPLKMVEVAPRVIHLIEKAGKEAHFFAGAVNTYVALHTHAGHAMGMLGRFDEGQALCEKGLRFASELKNPASIGWAEVNYGYMFVHKGDGENAVEHARSARKFLEEAQAIIILGLTRSALGMGYYFLGKMNTALEHAEEGLRIQSEIGIPFLLSLQHFYLSQINFDMDKVGEAREHIEIALELSQSRNEKHFEGRSRVLLGRILGKTESLHFDKAEESILQGIKILEELGTRPWFSEGYLYLGELYGRTGKKQKALENLKRAENMFHDMDMKYWLHRTQNVLDKL